MILSPIAADDVPARLVQFAACLEGEALATRVFARLAATWDLVTGDLLPGNLMAGDVVRLSEDPEHHRQAVALCHRFGLRTVDESPRGSFTWDGRAVRVRLEPSVIIHEVAHFQCASPSRRPLLDFGLGAGPESGLRADADQAASVFGVDRDREEALASLLGILWEVELNQPAILAFIEQNWLEGGNRDANRTHFLRNLGLLARHGLIDADGSPTDALRREEDDHVFFAPAPAGVTS